MTEKTIAKIQPYLFSHNSTTIPEIVIKCGLAKSTAQDAIKELTLKGCLEYNRSVPVKQKRGLKFTKEYKINHANLKEHFMKYFEIADTFLIELRNKKHLSNITATEHPSAVTATEHPSAVTATETPSVLSISTSTFNNSLSTLSVPSGKSVRSGLEIPKELQTSIDKAETNRKRKEELQSLERLCRNGQKNKAVELWEKLIRI
jgi:hypothetical protein